MDTISHRLLAHARTRPSAPAYFTRVDGRWQSTSWGTFVDECCCVARGLIAFGLPRGGTIALLGYNKPEWVIAYHAAMLAGGAAAGIYTTSSPDDVAHILKHSEAIAVVVEDRAQYEKVVAKSNVKWIITMRGAQEIKDPRVVTWRQLLARGRETDEDLESRIAAIDAGDTATLIYTSGTTGPPKGVMLSHANLTWSASTLVALGKGTEQDCVLSYLPLSHIAEQLATIHLPVTTGSPVYYCEAIDKVRTNVPEVRPTVFFGVPRVWEKFHAALVARFDALPFGRKQLLAWTRRVCTEVNERRMRGERVGVRLEAQYRVAQRLVLNRLRAALGMDRARILVSGSAPIAKHVLEFFASIDMVIQELYGMSECVPISYNVPGKTKLGSVGPPVPGLEVKIAEDGEVLVRGPGVFVGYVRDAAATAETLVDGWLHTGDIGELDRDGFLTITGRKKELLITAGGHNVAPKNLEESLKQCAAIGEAVVIGDRRKYLTVLVALAEGVSDSQQTRDEIQRAIDRLNATVARSEQIKKYAVVRPFSVETGELTPTMKIKRAAVTRSYAREIETMYPDEVRDRDGTS